MGKGKKRCIIEECTNSQYNVEVGMLQFPTDRTLAQKWCDFVGKTRDYPLRFDEAIQSQSYICADHFASSCFDQSTLTRFKLGYSRIRLKLIPGSVPTEPRSYARILDEEMFKRQTRARQEEVVSHTRTDTNNGGTTVVHTARVEQQTDKYRLEKIKNQIREYGQLQSGIYRIESLNPLVISQEPVQTAEPGISSAQTIQPDQLEISGDECLLPSQSENSQPNGANGAYGLVNLNSKHRRCAVCDGDYNYRNTRLFHRLTNEKTRHCLNLERIVGEEIHSSIPSRQYLCRNCSSRIETIIKNADSVIAAFDKTQDRHKSNALTEHSVPYKTRKIEPNIPHCLEDESTGTTSVPQEGTTTPFLEGGSTGVTNKLLEGTTTPHCFEGRSTWTTIKPLEGTTKICLGGGSTSTTNKPQEGTTMFNCVEGGLTDTESQPQDGTAEPIQTNTVTLPHPEKRNALSQTAADLHKTPGVNGPSLTQPVDTDKYCMPLEIKQEPQDDIPQMTCPLAEAELNLKCEDDSFMCYSA